MNTQIDAKNTGERAPRLEKSGWLKNDNPPGDPNRAPRCGAKTRRGKMCLAPAMCNGRCRMHGGGSTGPRTPEGLERSRRANWKHGLYSAKAKAAQRSLRQLLEDSGDLLRRFRSL
jgi:hypothetical protein